MSSGGTIRSTLDKPLGELTEEDISQLTREDCRRYLKEKGMRRPSWNKSQAIQQVLSLKALLESWPRKEDMDSRKSPSKASVADPGSHIPMDSVGEDPVNISEGSRSSSAGDGSIPSDLGTPATAPEPAPSMGRLPVSHPVKEGPDPPVVNGDAGSRHAVREPPGQFSMSSMSKVKADQMSIFYNGKVHVYDGVSPEKARAIMLLAASPGFMVQIPEPRPLPSSSSPRRGRAPSSPPSAPNLAASNADGPKTRKESVQRFLEKRKDSFNGACCPGDGRIKAACGRPKSCSSPLEVYLSQRMLDTGGTSSSKTPSPTNVMVPPVAHPTPGRPGTGQPVFFAGDLNEDGIQEVVT